MGKETKSRKTETKGKGKVTAVQIAFIVDRYLADNNYTNTRSTFRTEASDLISRSPVQEAPRSLLSLGAMLDEYISLKEQKVTLDQEKSCLEQEKFRVQTLLRGMQDVMNAYNIGTPAVALPPPMVANSSALVPLIDPTVGTPAGFPAYNTPVVMSTSRYSKTSKNSQKFSTPITNLPTSKRRKGVKDASDAPVTAKRSRTQSSTKLRAKDQNTLPQLSNVSTSSLQYSGVDSSFHDNISNGSSVQGSSVAKCLFNQPSQSPPTKSSFPNTPPRPTSSPTDKSISPQEVTNATSGNDITPQQMSSANSTVIASKTITVSPAKQVAFYSIERNCRISSSSPIKTNIKRFTKRDHVKGRLDFDGSGIATDTDKAIPNEVSASETEKDGDLFDFDLPNLDILGADFSFSELLGEFNIDGDGMSYPYQPEMDSSPDSGSPNTSDDAIVGAHQVVSELSSTVIEILSEKNMNMPGLDSVTSVKSKTKCIKILSPVKNQRSPSQDQENLSAKN